MGTSDSLFEASVGYCGQCKIQYVVTARIGVDDSHFQVEERYACPNCKRDEPQDLTKAIGEQLEFSRTQLDKRLHWQKPDGLEILASELY